MRIHRLVIVAVIRPSIIQLHCNTMECHELTKYECLIVNILDQFFKHANDELEQEINLMDRVRNQNLIIKFGWFVNAVTHVFFIQRPDQYNPFDRSTRKQIEGPMLEVEHESVRFLIEPHRRYLKFFNPFKPLGEKPHYEPHPIRVYILHCVNIFVFFRLLWLTSCILDCINVADEIRPVLRPQTWKPMLGDNCVKIQDIYYTIITSHRTTQQQEQSSVVEKLKLYNERYDKLKQIGSIALVHAPLLSYLFQFVMMLMLFCYLTSVYSKNRMLLLNSISFFLSPIEERSRLRRKLDSIVLKFIPKEDEEQELAKKINQLEIELDWGKIDTLRNRINQPEMMPITHSSSGEMINKRQNYFYSNSINAKSLNLSFNQDMEPRSRPIQSEKGRITYRSCSSGCSDDKCYCKLNKHKSVANFVQTIYRNRLIDYVRPNELDVKFHDRQAREQTIAQLIYTAMMSYWGFFLILVIVYAELRDRCLSRMAITYCKLKYDNSTTILHDPFRMYDEEITEEIIALYGNNNPNSGPNFSQLRYELAVATTKNSLINVAFLVYGYLHVATWTFYYMMCFVDGFTFQSNWINQIQNQLNNCIKLLEHLPLINPRLTSRQSVFYRPLDRKRNYSGHVKQTRKKSDGVNSFSGSFDVKELKIRITNNHCTANVGGKNEPKQEGDHHSEECNAKLIHDQRSEDIQKALIITYLNYELFRSEYQSFKVVCNFTLIYVIPLMVFDSLICYYWLISSIGRHAAQDIVICWSTNLTVVTVVNFYVAICVLLVEKIHKLNKTIYLLMAKINLNSMDHVYISELWRRQMMGEIDVKNVFCIQVMGNNFTLSTLLALDSYVLALWLIFFNSELNLIDSILMPEKN